MSPQSWDATEQTKQRWGQIGMCTAWPNRGQSVNSQFLQKDSTSAEQKVSVFLPRICPASTDSGLSSGQTKLTWSADFWEENGPFVELRHGMLPAAPAYTIYEVNHSIHIDLRNSSRQRAPRSILEGGHASERSLYIKKEHSCALANGQVLFCMWYTQWDTSSSQWRVANDNRIRGGSQLHCSVLGSLIEGKEVGTTPALVLGAIVPRYHFSGSKPIYSHNVLEHITANEGEHLDILAYTSNHSFVRLPKI